MCTHNEIHTVESFFLFQNDCLPQDLGWLEEQLPFKGANTISNAEKGLSWNIYLSKCDLSGDMSSGHFTEKTNWNYSIAIWESNIITFK